MGSWISSTEFDKPLAEISIPFKDGKESQINKVELAAKIKEAFVFLLDKKRKLPEPDSISLVNKVWYDMRTVSMDGKKELRITSTKNKKTAKENQEMFTFTKEKFIVQTIIKIVKKNKGCTSVTITPSRYYNILIFLVILSDSKGNTLSFIKIHPESNDITRKVLSHSEESGEKEKKKDNE